MSHGVPAQPASHRRSAALASGKPGSLFGQDEQGVKFPSRGGSLLCSATPCSSLEHLNSKVAPSSASKTSRSSNLSRAWLNNMVPALVNKVNKSTHSGSHSGRGKGAITMAFVCNETFDEPLTRVLQETRAEPEGAAAAEAFASSEDAQPEEGQTFEDWNVILDEVDAMQVNEMAGVLVVKPLFDEEAIRCPSGRNRAAQVLTQSALRGSVGDCCDEDDDDYGDDLGFDLAFESDVYSKQDGFSDIYAEEYGNNEEPLKRSYGIVLQSVDGGNPTVDGCYILNTTTSRSVGCACTHYSMSRASCGADGSCLKVNDQLDKAWLVNPFTAI